MDNHFYDNMIKSVVYQSTKTVIGVLALHLLLLWLAVLVGASLRTLGALNHMGALLVFEYGWTMFFTGLGIPILTIQMGCVLAHLIYVDKPHVEWLMPVHFGIAFIAVMCIAPYMIYGNF